LLGFFLPFLARDTYSNLFLAVSDIFFKKYQKYMVPVYLSAEGKLATFHKSQNNQKGKQQ